LAGNVALDAIKRAAAAHGLDWRALAAVSHYESGLDPGAVGDGGHAFGLFQLNNAGGTITGNPNPRQYLDPYKNADFAASAIARLGIGKLPVDQQAAQIVRRFERPARPDPEVQGALDWLHQNFKGNAGSTPPQVPAQTPPRTSTLPTNPRVPTQETQQVPQQTILQPGQGPSGAKPALLAYLMTNGAMAHQRGVDPNAGLVSMLMSGGLNTQQPTQGPTQAPTAGQTPAHVAQLPTANPKRPVNVVQDHGQAPAPGTNTVIDLARRYLGTPYKWGGANPKTGFDCSGLVQYVYAQKGIALPRTTYQQIKVGKPVNQQNLAPGDIVFFQNKGDVHHEGLYIGNGQFIHAPHTGDVIKISSLSDPYYQRQFAGGRRVT
jgi:cell wall-associated NlpC family hydrolase